MSRDFTALDALAGLAPDRRLRVASVLASPLQQQTIAGARSRFGSLSLASPRPLARDPRGPRNRKPPGTRPDSYKKERSRLEQASGHKGLPNAEGRRAEIGIVIVLMRARIRMRSSSLGRLWPQSAPFGARNRPARAGLIWARTRDPRGRVRMRGFRAKRSVN